MAEPVNLYDKQNRFRIEDVDGAILESAGDHLLIREPDTFKSIGIIVKRDKVTHGFNWEYSDQEVSLAWDMVRLNALSSILANDSDFSTGNWTHTAVTTYTANNDGVADRLVMGSGSNIERSFSGLTEGDLVTFRVKVEDIATTTPPSVATINFQVLTSTNTVLNTTQIKPVENITEYAEFKVSGTVPANGILKVRLSYVGNNLDFHIKEMFVEVNHYSPRSFIQDLYNRNGNNAKAKLHFESWNGSSWDTEYEGRLNFNSYRRKSNKVEVGVKRMNFDDKFRTRKTTKVWAKQQQDFDGTAHASSAPDEISMFLPSKVIQVEINVEDNPVTPVEAAINFAEVTTGNPYRAPFLLGMTTRNVVEWKDFFDYGTRIAGQFHDHTNALDNPYYTENFNFFICQEPGDYTMTITWDFDIEFDLGSGGPHTCDVYLYLIHKPASGTPSSWQLDTATGSGPGSSTYSLNVSGSDVDREISMDFGDELYLVGSARTASLLMTRAAITVNDCSIVGTALTTQLESEIKIYQLRDLLEHTFHMMTGESGAFQSSEMDAQGDNLWEMLVTNGKSIRGKSYDVADVTTYNIPPKYSWQDLFDSAMALFGLGFQIFNDSGTLKIQVEKFSYFYRSGTANTIQVIDETYDWEMWLDTDLVYNQVKVGYEKYLEGDEGYSSNALDEFNTYHEYLAPIETIENRKEILSRLIGSGYAIEATKRIGNTEDSWKFDDDLFIISGIYGNAITTRTQTTSWPGTGTSYVDFGERIPEFATAGSFTLNGVTNYTVSSVALGIDSTRVYVNETIGSIIINGAGVVITLFSDGAHATALNFWRPETDQPFTSVTGLISKETAFNIRLNPKFMFLNHAPYLNAGMFYVGSTGEYRNTFTKNNENLTARFASGENNTTIDPNRVSWEMGADVSFSNTDWANSLHRPERVSFKCKRTYDQVKAIRAALMNESATANHNRGNLFVKDDEGVYWIFFVDEMKYNPLREECQFMGRIYTSNFTLEDFAVRIVESGEYRITEDGGYRYIG